MTIETEAPMPVPGGALDPAFADAEVFVDKPRTPFVPPGCACRTAARYVELVNAGDFAGVAALFGDDATLIEPQRPRRRGRSEIDAFYAERIGAMRPEIVAVSFLGGDEECMVALALRTAIGGEMRHVLVSVDHFLVGADGRIVAMTAFARPPRGEDQATRAASP